MIKRIKFLTSIILGLVLLSTPSISTAQSTTTEFNVPGTYSWTVPSGVSYITVEVWGGGGRGGYGDSGVGIGGSGGGGGGYARSTYTVTPGAVYQVVVGPGGSSDLGTVCLNDPNNTLRGAPGGTSSFSTLLRAEGGKGGLVAGCPVFGGGAGGNGFIDREGINSTTITGTSGVTQNGGINGGNGGAGANGGVGGLGAIVTGYNTDGSAIGSNSSTGSQPGGGGGGGAGVGGFQGDSSNGGHGKVVITSVTPTNPNFDFSLSNGGDKTIVAGNSNFADNTITATLVQGNTQKVDLTVTSITNSSGNSVLNKIGGLFVQNDSFTKPSLYPTDSTNLYISSQASTPIGTYDVTVTGNFIGINGNTTTNNQGVVYKCKLDWENDASGNHQYDGFFFGCVKNSEASSYSPKTAYNAGDDYFTTKCINTEAGGDVDAGLSCKRVGVNTYRAGSIGEEVVIDFRRSMANRECGGDYTMSGNESVYSTYFTCGISGGSTSGSTATIPPVTKTTTFKINVIDNPYNLTLTSNESCNASDLKIVANWSAYPNASSYKVYISKAGSPISGSPITVTNSTYTLQPVDSSVMYTFKVAAIVGGVEQVGSSELSTSSSLKTNCGGGGGGNPSISPSSSPVSTDLDLWIARTQNVSKSNGHTNLTVKKNADVYANFSSANANPPCTKIGDKWPNTNASTNFINTKLVTSEVGGPFILSVKCFDSDGKEKPSNQVQFKVIESSIEEI